MAAGGGLIGVIILLLTMFGGEQGSQIGQVLQQVNQGGGGEQQMTQTRELTQEEKELGAFAATVFADCEDVWNTLFQQEGMTYREPKMVLFSDEVTSECGKASAAMGPFYCPADETVYMDMTFFKELKTRYGAKGGDIEEAMSAAHAVGDDTIQKRARGYIEPDSFTHGTSEERKESFMRGFNSGKVF